MRKILAIGVVILVAAVATIPAFTSAEGPVASSVPKAPAASAGQPTLEQRLATAERKLANLERVMGIALDDDRAIAQFEREMKEGRQPSAQAKAASLISNLQTVRSQMELYNVQHNSHYPDLAHGWKQFTERTDASGKLMKEKDGGIYGPYLLNEPVNPLTGSAKVITDATKASAAAGWYYNPTNSELKAVVSKRDAEALKFSDHDVITY